MTVDHEVAGSGAASHISHYESFNIPLRPANASDAPTSAEEWEYEYSQTETEDYFLTLDLSTPSIPTRRPNVPRGLRGAYKAKWITPGLGRNKYQRHNRTKITVAKATPTVGSQETPVPTAAVDNNDEDEEEGDMDEDDEMADPDAPEVNEGGEDIIDEEQVRKLEDIQILDLHAENPMVSYRGHIFSCSWAENIGTELLWTRRDPASPLPALRSFKDDVDLLAACSARLVSTPVELVPKKSTATSRKRYWKQALAMDEEDEARNTQIEQHAGEERKEQAHFLEKLMALKIKKGERDDVTIIAQKRQSNRDWLALAQSHQEAERKELKAIVRRGPGHACDQARRRLAEMDIEEQDLEQERLEGRKRRAFGNDDAARRAGRDAKRVRRESSAVTVSSHAGDDGTPAPDGVVSQNALSIPTPRTWTELELHDEDAESAVDV